MNIRGKTIAVTGAEGFLGVALCQALLEREVQLVPLDILTGQDIMDQEAMTAALQGVDAVYHLAAIASPRQCEKDLQATFDVNVTGTFNMIQAAGQAKVERFMFMSSIVAYGEPLYLPIDETHPLNGRGAYATSKVIGEYLVRAGHDSYGMPFTIIRNSNTFGPHQDAEYLVPTLINQGMDGSIEVWDPRPVRDYLYLPDTIAAMVLLLVSDAAANEAVNIGSGVGTSVAELAGIVTGLTGSLWRDVNKPAAVASKLVADVSKLKALTGWKQMISLPLGVGWTHETMTDD